MIAGIVLDLSKWVLMKLQQSLQAQTLTDEDRQNNQELQGLLVASMNASSSPAIGGGQGLRGHTDAVPHAGAHAEVLGGLRGGVHVRGHVREQA